MPPEVGTTDKSTAATSATSATSSGQSGASAPLTSSGTASEAMIAAATAASSAAPEPAAGAGDTTQRSSAGNTGTIPDATAQAAAAGPTGTKPTGTDAPEQRIVAATRNAREQATREVEARYEAFKGLDPAEVKLAMQVLTELRTDTAKFHRELTQRISGGTGDAEEKYPDADLVSKDGTMKTYTDGTMQKVLDVHTKRVTTQVMKELKPFLDFARSEQGRQEQTAAETKRVQSIDSALVEARKMPHFTKENEPAIIEVMGQIVEASSVEDRARFRSSPAELIHRAYNSFLQSKVFPTIDAEADKRVRAEYARKAAAGSGSAHPTQQGGDPKPAVIRNGDVDGLARHMERLAETAAAS